MWVKSMEHIEYTAQLKKFSKKRVACLIHKRKTHYSPIYYNDNSQTSQLLITRIISQKKKNKKKNIFFIFGHFELFCTFTNIIFWELFLKSSNKKQSFIYESLFWFLWFSPVYFLIVVQATFRDSILNVISTLACRITFRGYMCHNIPVR